MPSPRPHPQAPLHSESPPTLSFSSGPSTPTRRPLFPEASPLGQPDVSHLISLRASQACGSLFPELWQPRAAPGPGEEWGGRGGGVLPKLTSRFSGSPLYQPTKARAENTPGSSSPGISRA